MAGFLLNSAGLVLGTPMQDTDHVEHPGVAKVKQMFDRGDFETIDKMVRFWEAMENIGVAGDLLKRLIVWIGIVAGGYIVGAGYIADLIGAIKK
jgi:hypothetical protein